MRKGGRKGGREGERERYLNAVNPVHVQMLGHGGHPLSRCQPKKHPILCRQPHIVVTKVLKKDENPAKSNLSLKIAKKIVDFSIHHQEHSGRFH